jgi:myosin-crossreactive antigen
MLRKLGCWQLCNNLLVMGADLAQPKHFVVDIDLLKYVYEITNSADDKKLRGYIMTMVMQRSPIDLRLMRSFRSLEIMHDSDRVLRMLSRIRKRYPQNKDKRDETFDVRKGMGARGNMHYMYVGFWGSGDWDWD